MGVIGNAGTVAGNGFRDETYINGSIDADAREDSLQETFRAARQTFKNLPESSTALRDPIGGMQR